MDDHGCVCVRMCANVQVCLVSVCFPVTVCVEIRRMAIRGVCVSGSWQADLMTYTHAYTHLRDMIITKRKLTGLF